MKRSERISGFVETIWDWYSRHKRILPWRDLQIEDENIRAYYVLVSEVMLQQTQVSRVQNIFKVFIEKFSSMEELSHASNRDVLMAWRGMGYNSRALRLRDAVRTIHTEHAGVFPQEMKDLQKISGIGPYTAAAIRNFAWNRATPCIDTNIRRILHRTFYGPENPDGTWKIPDRELLVLAEKVLDIALDGNIGGRDAANWHAALMDFGSLIQTKNNPKWEICPLTKKGLMNATKKSFELRVSSGDSKSRLIRQEPGRFIGNRFIPNRIFRGRIIEALRDASLGLTLEDIGKDICIDWNTKEHSDWLQKLINKLIQEKMIEQSGKRYMLQNK